MAAKQGIKVIPAAEQLIKNAAVFDSILDKVKFNSIGGGRCVAEYKVAKESSNIFGQIHGGCSAMLVNSITSYALYSNKGSSGISIDLNMTYVKPAMIGEEIIIEASTIREGKSLSYLICDIKRKSNGELLAKGSTTKQMTTK